MPTTVRDGYILKIKAVLFDLGDTLTTPWLLEDTFHKILLSLGINKSIEDVKRAISQTRQDLRNLDCSPKYGEASYTEYWSLWRSFVLKHLDLHDNERLLREIEAKWSNYVECKAHDDVKETLLKLRKWSKDGSHFHCLQRRRTYHYGEGWSAGKNVRPYTRSRFSGSYET